MLTSATGTGWERTPWRAVQGAARDALTSVDMTKAGSEGDQYLREYPHPLKWINQCAACLHRGREPEMQAEIFPGVAAQYLRRYFDELALTTIYRAWGGQFKRQRGDRPMDASGVALCVGHGRGCLLDALSPLACGSSCPRYSSV